MEASQRIRQALVMLAVITTLTACDDGVGRSSTKSGDQTTDQRSASAEPTINTGTVAHSDAVTDLPNDETVVEAFADDALLQLALAPWKGDLDGMLKRGMIRVAVPFGPTTYYIDGGRPAGMTPMRVTEFEKGLKKKYGAKARKLTMVYVPSGRSNLLDLVANGHADIAAADITITAGRLDLVDFSLPFRTGAREVLVYGPSATGVTSADELTRYPIYVREKSSFASNLRRLNVQRAAEGKPEFDIEYADPSLNGADLLELVNAGVVAATVGDEFVYQLISNSVSDLHMLEEPIVADDTEIAWALRKESPLLKAELDAFAKRASSGTLLGNVMLNKYKDSREQIDNALSADRQQSYNEHVDTIRRYADEYQFDWLMITAQAYQESRLDNSKRSPAGAIGIMQVKPSTAKDPNVGIDDITSPDNNVHAGVKYLRFIRDRYFSDASVSDLDQTLMSFAAYNAGPGAIRKARREAKRLGLDPNVWLDNVEVAVERKIGREPVIYVRNIYKYYVAYRLAQREVIKRQTLTQ